ncbi:uncharacterized protein LOC124899758 [Capsicum annuum]|uniref:uncharacterized protein LOC124899758 n=1 Tax=Capsicum annuum TaxID=4072 RepID=UPI001FB0FD41|nr:uncharacterized protein LOC124899758 [Capsicum annuum]
MIMVFVAPIQFCTNNYLETRAALERSIQVQLCYGEGNQVVDILATSLDSKEFYYNEVELPCDARACCGNDVWVSSTNDEGIYRPTSFHIDNIVVLQRSPSS